MSYHLLWLPTGGASLLHLGPQGGSCISLPEFHLLTWWVVTSSATVIFVLITHNVYPHSGSDHCVSASDTSDPLHVFSPTSLWASNLTCSSLIFSFHIPKHLLPGPRLFLSFPSAANVTTNVSLARWESWVPPWTLTLLALYPGSHWAQFLPPL